MPSAACTTGSDVCIDSRWASALSCCGARCCTSTMANPGCGGRACSSCVNASSPPADAPIPTTTIWDSAVTMAALTSGFDLGGRPALRPCWPGFEGFFGRRVLAILLPLLRRLLHGPRPGFPSVSCRGKAILEQPADVVGTAFRVFRLALPAVRQLGKPSLLCPRRHAPSQLRVLRQRPRRAPE